MFDRVLNWCLSTIRHFQDHETFKEGIFVSCKRRLIKLNSLFKKHSKLLPYLQPYLQHACLKTYQNETQNKKAWKTKCNLYRTVLLSSIVKEKKKLCISSFLFSMLFISDIILVSLLLFLIYLFSSAKIKIITNRQKKSFADVLQNRCS